MTDSHDTSAPESPQGVDRKAEGGNARVGERLARPSAVGSYPPNAFGLYDAHGNVMEWCSDWYDPRYYAGGAMRNPKGPAQGQLRLLRGGSWLVADVRMLSCSYRHKVPPDTYSYGIGFRVACTK